MFGQEVVCAVISLVVERGFLSVDDALNASSCDRAWRNMFWRNPKNWRSFGRLEFLDATLHWTEIRNILVRWSALSIHRRLEKAKRLFNQVCEQEPTQKRSALLKRALKAITEVAKSRNSVYETREWYHYVPLHDTGFPGRLSHFEKALRGGPLSRCSIQEFTNPTSYSDSRGNWIEIEKEARVDILCFTGIVSIYVQLNHLVGRESVDETCYDSGTMIVNGDVAWCKGNTEKDRRIHFVAQIVMLLDALFCGSKWERREKSSPWLSTWELTSTANARQGWGALVFEDQMSLESCLEILQDVLFRKMELFVDCVKRDLFRENDLAN